MVADTEKPKPRKASWRSDVRPEVWFVGSFALLTLLGAALLLLPGAVAEDEDALTLVDALFTSTSAVCVTGLTVRDTGSTFTLGGQALLLALIQIGGLGIITFIGMLLISTGKSSVAQLVTLRKIVNANSISDVRRYLLVILLTAGVIEVIGALLLYFSAGEIDGTVPERLFWALFHSVSAFCNAGFSLQADSLVTYSANWPVNLTVMGLIVGGGLGAPVVLDLWDMARTRRKGYEGKRPRLRIQSRLTLALTAALILLGALAFGLLEASGVSADDGTSTRTLTALFQSVTTRTAGFNTVPIDELSDATLILVAVLMVIGASPVSTGGGIKTVAFAVLLLTLRSMLTGRRVEAFGRTIPDRYVRAAMSVFLLYLFGAGLAFFLLSLTDPNIPFADRLFETISAMSTVGLSTGPTAELSASGKLILCAAMFAGRVGPLTLVMTVVGADDSRAAYELPEEPLVLG